MKILFLSTWFPYPPDNGSKIRVYHLLRALGSKHQVTLVSFAFETAEPEVAGELHHFCAEVQAIPINPFERRQMFPGSQFLSLSPIVSKPVPTMRQAVQDILARTTFDVVVASTEVTATYALLTPPTTAKVLEEHNSLTRWMWERYQEQASAVQRLRCWASWQKTRHYEARLFRRFVLCVMVSEQDRQASLQMLPGYGGPVEVIPNGVDCQHNTPGLAGPAPNTLVFNGSLTYQANYDAMRYFLAEVYPLIRQQSPAVSLTITGSTSRVNLAGLSLDGNAHLSGYVDDVRPLVAGASVCVVPIRQGSGTRLKILEAMALGTPVVATSKGAEGLDVTDGEHILLADEPATFAERTLQLLSDSALRWRLAVNARRLVEERYDWRQIGQRFADLVEETARTYRERL
ncbi:MAG: glycosyltransferase [Anaerolineae bacterium]|nr:glycosyltransferase [Anaerolineae bacterium]